MATTDGSRPRRRRTSVGEAGHLDIVTLRLREDERARAVRAARADMRSLNVWMRRAIIAMTGYPPETAGRVSVWAGPAPSRGEGVAELYVRMGPGEKLAASRVAEAGARTLAAWARLAVFVALDMASEEGG